MKDRVYDIQRNIHFSVLDDKAKEYINEAALQILEEVGVVIGGERALKMFADRGFTPDENGYFKIPRETVKWALSTVPHSLTLYGMDGKERMVIDKRNHVYFGTHNDMAEMVDYKTNQARPMLKEDIQLQCKLASNLENIDFVLSVGLVQDVDPQICQQVCFIESLKYMEKTINFSTNTIEALQEMIDIAAMVAGGKDKLAEKPFCFHYCEPIPPLTHPVESTEKLIICAENMMPTVYMPYCMMGGTSPLDRAASLAQCWAEILSGVVISQFAKEGAPIIAGAMPSIMDMNTMIASYACPEFHVNIAAAADMADYYDLPFFGTAGTSDARCFDLQSASEISYEILSTLMSKANIIHDVGLHDHCNSICPASVVIANELINMHKSYVKGVVVESLDDCNIDAIKEVGPAGNYLTQELTLMNFRDEVWYPEIYTRGAKNPLDSQIYGKIVEVIDDIVANKFGSTLDPEMVKKLDEIEQKYLDSVKK